MQPAMPDKSNQHLSWTHRHYICNETATPSRVLRTKPILPQRQTSPASAANFAFLRVNADVCLYHQSTAMQRVPQCGFATILTLD